MNLPLVRDSNKHYDEKAHSFQRTTSYSSHSKYEDLKLPPNPSTAQLAATSTSGPPVLDKFGNFRRAPATVESTLISGNAIHSDKPPEPSYRRSDGHSRSRSGRSRSKLCQLTMKMISGIIFQLVHYWIVSIFIINFFKFQLLCKVKSFLTIKTLNSIYLLNI